MSRITILYLTDVHGRIEAAPNRALPALMPLMMPPGRKAEVQGGLAALESLVLSEKQKCAGWPLMLVHCGDLVGIEMFHDEVKRGLLTLEALETLAERAEIEHCYAVVGNHEMDFGVDGFLALRGATRRFRFCAGNLKIDGQPVSRPMLSIEIGELRVALLNLTVEATRSDAPPSSRLRLAVDDPVGVADHLLAAVDADLVIGIVHLADEQDRHLISRGGLDLLLGGHSHVFYNHPPETGTTRYCKAGCFAQVLGTITLEVSRDRVEVLEDRSWLLPAVVEPGFDSLVEKRFHVAMAEIEKERPEEFRIVARLPEPIPGIDRVRSSQVPIGRLVAEMMLTAARRASPEPVHFAFINGGNVRQDLPGPSQDVRMWHLKAIVPWNNEILIVRAGPEVVRRVLYNFVACAKLEPQGYLQMAGIRFRVEASGEVGAVQVQDPSAGAAPAWRSLDELAELRFATIDYLIREGGHHYGFFGEEVVQSTGRRLQGAWLDMLEGREDGGLSVIAPPTPEVDVTFAEGFLSTPPEELRATISRATGDSLAWVGNPRA